MPHGWMNSLDCQGSEHGAGLGFSMGYGESPQKIGVVGCETSRGKRVTQTHNVGFQFPTVYTYTLQYLLHFDYKPFGRLVIVTTNQSGHYSPGWYTGLASSMWPKWPGHSDMPSPQIWHLKLRSMVPIRGSISPPIFLGHSFALCYWALLFALCYFCCPMFRRPSDTVSAWGGVRDADDTYDARRVRTQFRPALLSSASRTVLLLLSRCSNDVESGWCPKRHPFMT